MTRPSDRIPAKRIELGVSSQTQWYGGDSAFGLGPAALCLGLALAAVIAALSLLS